MRKAVVCIVVMGALFLGGTVAFGEDCQQLTLMLKPDSTDLNPADYQFLADYFGVLPFEWCWSQRVIGTIQGTWVFCGSFADLYIPGPLFGTAYPTAGPELYGNPGIIYTRKGDIYTMSYGLSLWEGVDWVAFGGVTWFGGGTGDYAGATGWGTDAPKKYPPSYHIQNNGLLCVPD